MVIVPAPFAGAPVCVGADAAGPIAVARDPNKIVAFRGAGSPERVTIFSCLGEKVRGVSRRCDLAS